PDRSGLPFNRGAGAVMLILPSFVRGAPAIGWFTHCAPTETPAPRHTIAIGRTTRNRRVMVNIYPRGSRVVRTHPFAGVSEGREISVRHGKAGRDGLGQCTADGMSPSAGAH